MLDFQLKTTGMWYLKPKKLSQILWANPDACEPYGCFGYTDDTSIPAVLIHEFCHFIDDKIRIYDKYKDIFKENDLVLNINSIMSIEELCIECMGLYIINPYFLEMIDKNKYEFFKSQIRSPIDQPKSNFKKLYSKWTKEYKTSCKRDWKIYVEEGNIIHK
jgi:hypothetical protein